jgi:hypothetical protein
MNKRPKSREETPKEGSDSARRYRTATICGRAAQIASPFESFSVQKVRKSGTGAKKSHKRFGASFQSLKSVIGVDLTLPWTEAFGSRQFVIPNVHRKYTIARTDSSDGKLTAHAGIGLRSQCALSWIGLGRTHMLPARATQENL